MVLSKALYKAVVLRHFKISNIIDRKSEHERPVLVIFRLVVQGLDDCMIINRLLSVHNSVQSRYGTFLQGFASKNAKTRYLITVGTEKLQMTNCNLNELRLRKLCI